MGMTSDNRQVAAFALQMAAQPVPATVAAKVRDLVLDQLGLQLAGAHAGEAQVARNYVHRFPAPGRAVIVGDEKGMTVAPEQAAFVNSCAGRHGDYDDYCAAAPGGHIGAAVVPVGLAMAQQVGASGVEAVRAMAVGGEVMARAAAAGGDGSATGPAVTAGLLLQLDRHRLADAIGLAATVRAGLNSYDRRGAAAAAASGVLAAYLAATGPAADVTTVPVEWHTKGLGETFLLERQAMKKYACHASVHAAVDALLALVSEHAVAPRRIAHMRVGIGRRALAAVGERTVTAALAQTLLLGVPTSRTGRAAGLSDAEVTAWTSAIQVYDDEVCTYEEDKGDGAVVTLFLADGGELRQRMRHARGTPENPMTGTELRAKFLGHAIPEVGLDRAVGLDAVVWRLPVLTTLEPVTALLAGSIPEVYVTT